MKKVIILIVLLFFMPNIAKAEQSNQILNEQIEFLDEDSLTNALPDETKKLMQDVNLLDIGTEFGIQIKNIIGQIISAPSRFLNDVLSPIIKILIIVVICGIGTGLSSGQSKFNEKIINITGAFGITTIMLNDMNGMFTEALNTITNLDVFSKALLPSVAGVLTLTGAPITGATSYATTVFAFDLLITFISHILVPTVYSYIAMITVNAALSNDALKRLCDFLKWASTTLLKFFLTIFITYISISSVITSNVGSLAVKTTKFAVSGAVPIVGGIISDATETFLSSAVVLKNSVGVFGMIAIISICFLPLLQIGINFLIFKLSAAIITPIATPSLSGLIDGLSGGFSMLFSMLSTCAIILFAQLVIIILLVRPL